MRFELRTFLHFGVDQCVPPALMHSAARLVEGCAAHVALGLTVNSDTPIKNKQQPDSLRVQWRNKRAILEALQSPSTSTPEIASREIEFKDGLPQPADP